MSRPEAALRAVPGGVELTVRAVPRSAAAGIAGIQADAIRIRLTAPPVEGAANDELVRVVARAFGVARGAVTIESGGRSRSKRVRIAGIDAAAAAAVLAAWT